MVIEIICGNCPCVNKWNIVMKLWKGTAWNFDILTISWRRYLLYRNQSLDLQSKSMDWFLYDRNFRHERVKLSHFFQIKISNINICCLYESNIEKQPLEVLYEKGVFESSGKFNGKHVRLSLSFNKISGLRPATLLKTNKQELYFFTWFYNIF